MISSHLLQRSGLLLAVGLSALALGACGSDSDDASPSSGSGSAGASPATNDQDTARVKLTQCLRENGIDVPDNVGQSGPGPDVDQDELQAALDGPCKELQAGAFGDAAGDNQEFRDAYNVFAQCMRQNGVDLPDLKPGEGPAQTHGNEPDPTDPGVQAAQEKCQDKLPQGGPGGGH